MLEKIIGNTMIGKTPNGHTVRIIKTAKKTISTTNGIIREKTIKEIPLEQEKDIFQKAFPQYNDFKMILRHDLYKGNRFGTHDIGYVKGIKPNSENVVLMRQEKRNSDYSDIKIGFNTNRSVLRTDNEFEAITVEPQIYKPSDFQLPCKEYTEVTNAFARAYLNGSDRLQSTEKATDEFYKLMRKETTSII